MNIKEATIENARQYVRYTERFFKSNGKDGIIFSPREAGSYKASEKDIEEVKERWNKTLEEPGYEKAWLVWDEDKVVGHTFLRSGQIPSVLHRLDLQIGLEEEYRKQGIGKELTKIVLKWATESTTVEWIDLAVLGTNEPAIKLYKSFGFVEVGKIEDRFRVSGQSVDSIYMVLKIDR